MKNKNMTELEELEKQKEKNNREKWTVWQNREKLEDKIDPPVLPEARILLSVLSNIVKICARTRAYEP